MIKDPLSARVYKGFWEALDWIYPPACLGCGEPGYRICVKCLSTMTYIEGDLCAICGRPKDSQRPLCQRCARQSPVFSGFRSLTWYEGLARECVHALKYERNLSLGDLFGAQMTALLRQAGWGIDLVVPVPLSPAREKDRGYNQATLLARPVALRLEKPIKPFALKRTRNTRSQVDLGAAERQVNVAGAFQAVPECVSGLKILLVDDVSTTGATLRECTLALSAAGAEAVYWLTFSRTGPDGR